MKLIGITGGVASGKTTVRKFFEDLGAVSIDADILCHKKIEEVKEELVKEFGEEVVKDGKVDRKRLREIIFQDNEARRKLEGILHPYVKEEILRYREKKNGKGVVVCEVPLLFEVGWEDLFDKIVVVNRCEDKRVESLVKKGFTKKQAEQIIRIQLPLREKVKLAHHVIDNQGDLSNTFLQVENLWKRWAKEE
ncbi:MAG: dephospho-CoA kinase [Caldiserica bacterium]|nr:dephospho-CoA kinase [Caldisericota bacterium]